MVAGLSFVPSALGQQKDERQDGFWWEDQNILEKMGFVVGLTTMATKASVLCPEFLRQAGIRQNAKITALIEENFDFSNIAYGQYLEGLAKFYGDFRNKQIQVEDAIHYVRDEVRGVGPEKLQVQLLALRKFASSEQKN